MAQIIGSLIIILLSVFATACVDDPNGILAQNSVTCAQAVQSYTCDGTTPFSPSTPVKSFCPQTCNACPPTNAPGNPTASPTAPTPFTGVCKDDASGTIGSNGYTCAQVIGAFSCNGDLGQVSAPLTGTKVFSVCPVSCKVCTSASPTAAPTVQPGVPTSSPTLFPTSSPTLPPTTPLVDKLAVEIDCQASSPLDPAKVSSFGGIAGSQVASSTGQPLYDTWECSQATASSSLVQVTCIVVKVPPQDVAANQASLDTTLASLKSQYGGLDGSLLGTTFSDWRAIVVKGAPPPPTPPPTNPPPTNPVPTNPAPTNVPPSPAPPTNPPTSSPTTPPPTAVPTKGPTSSGVDRLAIVLTITSSTVLNNVGSFGKQVGGLVAKQDYRLASVSCTQVPPAAGSVVVTCVANNIAPTDVAGEQPWLASMLASQQSSAAPTIGFYLGGTFQSWAAAIVKGTWTPPPPTNAPTSPTAAAPTYSPPTPAPPTVPPPTNPPPTNPPPTAAPAVQVIIELSGIAGTISEASINTLKSVLAPQLNNAGPYFQTIDVTQRKLSSGNTELTATFPDVPSNQVQKSFTDLQSLLPTIPSSQTGLIGTLLGGVFESWRAVCANCPAAPTPPTPPSAAPPTNPPSIPTAAPPTNPPLPPTNSNSPTAAKAPTSGGTLSPSSPTLPPTRCVDQADAATCQDYKAVCNSKITVVMPPTKATTYKGFTYVKDICRSECNACPPPPTSPTSLPTSASPTTDTPTTAPAPTTAAPTGKKVVSSTIPTAPFSASFTFWAIGAAVAIVVV
eukprot:CAMPEP_0175140984 /NCGR_PEP_ID=MMETSP0087-20121206/11826_1 /TAXON_ID=136419 /ORGANISM="Unknown Unknown, Strain D1" /LENGTH=785 /DNA_ID=CAMNT_0016424295 /DNA_START=24 /DNA_END=2381 /DNA_ORIENTATION=+